MARNDEDTAGAWGALLLVLLVFGVVIVLGQSVTYLTGVYRRHGRHPVLWWLVGLWLASLPLAGLIGASVSAGAGAVVALASTGLWLVGVGISQVVLDKRLAHARQEDDLDQYLSEW
jgi:hypothetical protein